MQDEINSKIKRIVLTENSVTFDNGLRCIPNHCAAQVFHNLETYWNQGLKGLIPVIGSLRIGTRWVFRGPKAVTPDDVKEGSYHIWIEGSNGNVYDILPQYYLKASGCFEKQEIFEGRD